MRSPRQSMIPAPAAAPPPSRGQALDHPVLQCAKRAFDASLRLRAVGADDVDVQRQQGATELGYPVAAGSLLAVHPLNDVLHRSSSHRCSPRRSAPSPSPTLPHRISRSRGVKSRPTCPSCGRPQHAGPLPIARSTPKPSGASSQPTHRWREMDSNPRSPVCGELGAPGPRATRPRAIVKPRNADRSRRQARRAICACLGRLSHGQSRPRAGDRLRRPRASGGVPVPPSRQCSRSVGTIRFVGKAAAEIAVDSGIP
jgi:hypothetical protein